MKAVNPYLNFNGNTEEAFHFYKSIFGGDFLSLMRWSDMPNEVNEGPELTEEQKNKIMHIALQISPNTLLMGSDTPNWWGSNTNFGNNLYISLQVDSREEADKLFTGLSKGGKVNMPMADQFWGDYFGDCIDKFGVCWMINYALAK